MYKYLLATGGALLFMAATSNAQPMRASIVGNGDPNSGRCTVEIVVDGSADVEINGETANLRNTSGRPPQWRRFECTGRMPANPVNFRFRGVDGRGRQELIRDPRSGGPAVVRIEDKDGGAEGYTFELTWGGGEARPGWPQSGGGPGPGPVPGGRRWTQDEAIRACRDEVRGRAAERFGSNIRFEGMRMEDNPDRRDWVTGSFTTPRDRGVHRFACSVNFDNGSLRWAQIDPPGGRFGSGAADRFSPRQSAVQNCQSAVASRMRDRGLRDVQFGRIGLDDNPGRNDWVVGDAWGSRGYGGRESFNFSCRVNLNDGDVRSVDLNRR
jgi:hypothetical protein